MTSKNENACLTTRQSHRVRLLSFLNNSKVNSKDFHEKNAVYDDSRQTLITLFFFCFFLIVCLFVCFNFLKALANTFCLRKSQGFISKG